MRIVCAALTVPFCSITPLPTHRYADSVAKTQLPQIEISEFVSQDLFCHAVVSVAQVGIMVRNAQKPPPATLPTMDLEGGTISSLAPPQRHPEAPTLPAGSRRPKMSA